MALAESQLGERGFAGGSDCESDSRHHPWNRVALRTCDFKRTWPALAFLGLLQVIAVVLNLIPIPPLDGYGVIAPFLPDGVRQQANQFAGFGVWILFFLMWYVPIFGALFWGIAGGVASLMGVPLQLAFLGQSQFQFWIK